MTTYDDKSAPPTYDNNMPSTYDNSMPTVSQNEGIVSVDYIKSVKGMLKAGEMLGSILVLICATVWETQLPLKGGGWTTFVAMASLIYVVIIYVMCIFRIYDKIINSIGVCVKIEFFTYVGISLCYTISFIVACAYASRHAAIGAAAFFLVATLGAFGVDTFFSFRAFRNRPMTTTTTTTTTTQQPQQPGLEAGPQY